MKKCIIFTIMLIAIFTLHAQTNEYDALKLVQKDIIGTARYMGMAGAFGALGGDVSAIKDNPAGLGIFRRSEFTATFNYQNQFSKSEWDGMSVSDDLFKVGFNNFSYVMSFETLAGIKGENGLLQSNFGFTYNRLKNFNRNATIRNQDMISSLTDFIASYSNFLGVSDNDFLYENGNLFIDDEFFFNEGANIPFLTILGYESGIINYNNGQWNSFLNEGDLTSPSYYLRERGFIDEYSLSWGGNINNMIYVGAALNYTTISYSKSVNYYESYSPSRNRTDLHKSSLLETWGNGVNFNIGVIVRPFDQLRIGLAYLTPTRYSMRDNTFNAFINNFSPAPNTYYDYELKVPGRVTGSVAYIIGQKAIISTDFSYTDYSNTKLYDRDGVSRYYQNENDVIAKAKGGITAKVGAEYRITDNFSVRAGFAAETAIRGEDMGRTTLNTVRIDPDYFIHNGKNYITVGLGYRTQFWNFDFAFVNKNLNEKFYPYYWEDMNAADVTTRNFDIVATIGFRF